MYLLQKQEPVSINRRSGNFKVLLRLTIDFSRFVTSKALRYDLSPESIHLPRKIRFFPKMAPLWI